MDKPTVSVIMSAYNESSGELERSIASILNQSFGDFEFIIVNDNPENRDIKRALKSADDDRIRILENERNLGLVASLNRAIGIAEGCYIARMDADDISMPKRLEDQLAYLTGHGLDLIGSFLELIDEKEETIRPLMRFPVETKRIEKYMRWGSCLAHPSWFGKKEVFTALQGYRGASHCEDYDFLLRAIKTGYKMGNIPEIELKYRIRTRGISRANREDQYLLRSYLAAKKRVIDRITEEEIAAFLNSEEFRKKKERLLRYNSYKESMKQKGGLNRAVCLGAMFVNPYMWKDVLEKLTLYLRER